jgi:hypothetical protein
MNNPNTTAPAASPAPALPSKDYVAVPQPAQAQAASVAPVTTETVPAAKV